MIILRGAYPNKKGTNLNKLEQFVVNGKGAEYLSIFEKKVAPLDGTN